MKLACDQLVAHFQHTIAPIYLVTGDESLLVQEACVMLYQTIETLGYSERLRFTVASGFDWAIFRQAYQNMSIFADKQSLILHLALLKLSEEGTQSILQILKKPNPSKIVIMIAGKLDAQAQRSSWVKAIEKAGVWVPIWPIPPAQMTSWVLQRLKKLGLAVERQGVQFLIEHTWGNLLATAQAIEKLALLYPPHALARTTGESLSLAQVQEVTENNAHYEVFDWIEAVLQGSELPALRRLAVLQGKGIEPTLLLWVFVKELRQLIAIKRLNTQGQPIGQAVRAQGVWEKRQALVSRAVQKHSLEALYAALESAGTLDQIIKGAISGNVWNGFMDLTLLLAGKTTCLLR